MRRGKGGDVPRRADLNSVLVIGSGPIVIGQACEFDYSGTQACRVLRQEGIKVSLVNSNPATIMTDPEFADATYVEPITLDVLEKVIAKERPDAVLPTLGGQTALNAAVALHEAGTLARYGVELIGADIEAIRAGEDRSRFKEIVTGLGAEVPESRICHSLAECEQAAAELGYPLVVGRRSPWAASGPGIAHDADELRRIAGAGLDASPVTEVLLEESILGWKEFELELMRDRHDNAVIVCSIENIDPMGVHTGDSVTVAPAMTLTDREYQHMRDVAIATARAVGVDTGGCNIQFAVHPSDRPHGRDRDEPAGVPVQRPGLEGDRLPDRQDRGAARDRLHPGRDPQRHHRRDPGQLRASARLRGGQGAEVRVREVPRRRPGADHAHEVGGRGDGDRAVLPRGAAEGAPVAGAPRRAAELGASRPATRLSWSGAAPARTTAGWPRCTRRSGRGVTWPSWPTATGIDPGSSTRSRASKNSANGSPWRARRPLSPDELRAAKAAGFSDAQLAQIRGTTEAQIRGQRHAAGRAAGVPHGGHLRRRVRRAHAVPVLDLRRARPRCRAAIAPR